MAKGVNGDQWYAIDDAEAIVVGKPSPDAQRYIAEGLADGRIRATADEPWVSNKISLFVEHYNHQRYHESLGNVAPVNAYFGRAATIIKQRERIKRPSTAYRHLQHRKITAKYQSSR